jgi:hypothetical protein
VELSIEVFRYKVLPVTEKPGEGCGGFGQGAVGVLQTVADLRLAPRHFEGSEGAGEQHEHRAEEQRDHQRHLNANAPRP